MRNALKIILFAVLCLAICSGVDAAEAIKFRLMAPIYVDGKGSGIKQPEGLSCRGNSLILADTGNGRLLRYTIAGETWTPGAEIVLPQLPYPIRVEANSKGEIFALDGKLRRIARISPSGEFQGYVDYSGELQGAVVPRSFRIDRNDNLIVLDVFSARVLVLDPSGKVQRQIPFPKEYGFFSDLAVDASGNIMLIDSLQRRVFTAAKNSQVITPLSESMKEEVYFPTAIAIDNRGTIFLVDQNGSGILVLAQDGTFRGRRLSMGWKDGFLRYPSQMCISETGNAFIADRENNRIEAFLITE
jgi:sugar lactone lactonase YvrE